MAEAGRFSVKLKAQSGSGPRVLGAIVDIVAAAGAYIDVDVDADVAESVLEIPPAAT